MPAPAPMPQSPARVNSGLLMTRLSLIAALVCATMFVACASKPRPPAYDPSGRTPSARPGAKPIITPVAGIQGKIARVNAVARFAVVTFAAPPLPEPGRVLGVYRDGLKVGELTVTPPAPVLLNVTGDITGDVQPGDEVRAN